MSKQTRSPNGSILRVHSRGDSDAEPPTWGHAPPDAEESRPRGTPGTLGRSSPVGPPARRSPLARPESVPSQPPVAPPAPRPSAWSSGAVYANMLLAFGSAFT